MKKTMRKLIHKSNSLTNLLFEQEDDLFADTGDEEEGGDEAADEGGDEAAEEDAPAEEEGEEGEEEEDEGEDEKLTVDVEEEVKLSKSIDQDLEALLIDFETSSRKSRQIGDEELTAAEEAVLEGRLSLSILLEQDEANYNEDQEEGKERGCCG